MVNENRGSVVKSNVQRAIIGYTHYFVTNILNKTIKDQFMYMHDKNDAETEKTDDDGYTMSFEQSLCRKNNYTESFN